MVFLSRTKDNGALAFPLGHSSSDAVETYARDDGSLGNRQFFHKDRLLTLPTCSAGEASDHGHPVDTKAKLRDGGLESHHVLSRGQRQLGASAGDGHLFPAIRSILTASLTTAASKLMIFHENRGNLCFGGRRTLVPSHPVKTDDQAR